MSWFVFILVLLSACLNVTWNLVTKKVSGNLSVVWIGLCFASIVLLPYVAWIICCTPWSSKNIWFLVATGSMQAVYFLLIAKAYEKGDVSFVYPIARGCGVAGAALFGAGIIGEAFATIGLLGIGIIAIGTILIGFQKISSPGRPQLLGLALLIGLVLVISTGIDKIAVKNLHPLLYIFGLFFLSAIFLAPYISLKFREQCIEAWFHKKKYSAIIGIGSLVSYSLILYAFRFGQLGYIVAVREVAIVIGAGLGILIFKEPLTIRKLCGIAAITIGLVLIRIA